MDGSSHCMHEICSKTQIGRRWNGHGIVVDLLSKKSILPMMLQHVRFLCLLWKCLVKGAAGSGTALDGCLPPTFFFFPFITGKKY